MDKRNCRYCGASIDHRPTRAAICEEPDCYRAYKAEYTRNRRRAGYNTVVRGLVDRACEQCGVEFRGRRDKDYEKRFCSEACRDEHWAAKAVRDQNGRKLTYGERKRLVFVDHVDREAIFERDGWICHICGNPIDPTLKFPDRWSASTDHIVPIAGLLGTDEPTNVKAAHWICNMKKTDKLEVNGEYSQTNRTRPGTRK